MDSYIEKKYLIELLMENYNPQMTFDDFLQLINIAENLTKKEPNIIKSQNIALLEIIKGYQGLIKDLEKENKLLKIEMLKTKQP